MGIDGGSVIQNVPYVENGNSRQVADIYFPPDEENGENMSSTIVIFVHGGGWTRGDKTLATIPCTMLASKGFCSLGISYTLCDEKIGPNYMFCLKDVMRAIAWSHSPSGAAALKFTPKNIFLVGHSSGAHLISMIAFNKKWLDDIDKEYNLNFNSYSIIRGIVGIGGVYDITAASENNRDHIEILSVAFGKDTSKWYKHSPATCDLELSSNGPIPFANVTPNDLDTTPQLLLLYSYEDELIDNEQVNKLANRYDFPDSDEPSSKIQIIGGHFGFHHSMYENDDLINFVSEFITFQISL